MADDERGVRWPILQRVEQWERMVDRTFAELEQRRQAPGQALKALVAFRYGSDA